MLRCFDTYYIYLIFNFSLQRYKFFHVSFLGFQRHLCFFKFSRETPIWQCIELSTKYSKVFVTVFNRQNIVLKGWTVNTMLDLLSEHETMQCCISLKKTYTKATTWLWIKLIIATIIYWGTITVFFISIIPIYRLFTIYKGRVNNKVW